MGSSPTRKRWWLCLKWWICDGLPVGYHTGLLQQVRTSRGYLSRTVPPQVSQYRGYLSRTVPPQVSHYQGYLRNTSSKSILGIPPADSTTSSKSILWIPSADSIPTQVSQTGGYLLRTVRVPSQVSHYRVYVWRTVSFKVCKSIQYNTVLLLRIFLCSRIPFLIGLS